MAKKKVSNSINEQIFYALKVTENSGIPTLIISNPGVGKSSTVSMFAQIRGYHLLTLRGNSTTADEITGYDTVPEGVREGDHRAACSLRPSWFQELMDIDAAGGKTLLFLDEITTANEFVQAALLHLVFERSCKEEKLPESTLIVAAGNYAQNLSASMTLLSPMMNRFMIFNVVPKSKDIRSFLNKYSGSSVNQDHKPDDKVANLRKMLVEMDKQEIVIPDEHYNQIGEFIENAFAEVTEMLMDGTSGEIDWNINDLSSIYSDNGGDTDPNLYGFVTLRTLCYLVEWTFSTYKCFGTAGIKSDNYMNAVNGLCGIGVSRKKGASDISVNKIGKKFQQAAISCIQNVERLNNNTLPEYNKFISNLISEIKTKKGVMTKEQLVAFDSKIKDLMIDKTIKNIERPVDENTVQTIIELIQTTSTSIRESLKKINTASEEDFDKSATPEMFGGIIENWNLLADFTNTITKLISDPGRAYKITEKNSMGAAVDTIASSVLRRMRSSRKLVLIVKTGAVLPEIHDLVSVNA